MSLPPEIKRLARHALSIKNSAVPTYMALEALASSGGDISRVLRAYADIKEPELRKALHYCAELLRAVAQEAGLAPQWDPANASPSSPAPPSSAPAPSSPAPAEKLAKAADDLAPFVDETARGKVRVAKAYTDGASKGNPGQSGIGVVIYTMEGKKIAQQAKAIGIATNNIAEYSALIEAMEMARDLEIKVLNVISDSELMVRQVSGVYKIKNVDILKKAQEVMALRRNFEKFTISYVGREHNKVADALSTSLLKPKGSSSKGGTRRKPSPGKAEGTAADFLDEGTTD